MPSCRRCWRSGCRWSTGSAISLRDFGLRDAGDIEIFQAAQKAQAVVTSKNSDFVELVSRHGSPPQLLWVTCGNVTNERLQAVFGKTFPDALESLASGQAIVEVG